MTEIETARLRLRRWRPDDVDALARIYAEPEVMRYLFPLDGRDGVAQQIERFESQWERLGFGKWAAEDQASGDLLGRIGLIRHDDWPLDPDNVEVGWTFARSHWGRGLATEGGLASLRFAFETIDIDRVISIIHPDNTASRRVAEKCGLTLRGPATWQGADVVW